ncbi:MAG: hypothetical protein WDN10_04920 [bacterium]
MSEQTYFDINKFPKDWGIIVFPISMSRIGNAQSPQACIDAMRFFLDKMTANRVGANFIYSEGLYMNFERDAFETKNRFANTAVSHMGGVRNLFLKSSRELQIDSALSFESWFQMYLSYKDFFSAFKSVRKLYEDDADFRNYVASDAKAAGKELTEEQLSFYLEEHTFAYLLMNRQLRLRNDFVNDREQWVLLAYPGMPLLGQVYLVQKDPLGINDDSNPYKGQYNLEKKVFIPYLKVDLENPNL